MNITLLVELNVGDDTDVMGIALDLRDLLDQQFPYETISVKPWQRASTTPINPLMVPPAPTL
ncbi:hypothetical protein UFOVP1319_26 [uncultured Caudovirales phage]|uniref:Uncharacterized protein n=1 Tax=uncultured Caudovirales phage TaxID=2100421 RepID=A0A6J5ML45_9CAUD|nr:hypothetical protein UFOVP478_9 [uncultured Caudovirales phage]CAB4191441.1 hypothetical protein UFOVP1225_36 [uncultured Caudovirales phage]CAB4197646.1 hypothetical protein UFOVP1319_26 [uncultured Caudovirales phage]CAB4217511.1 hypothetical protein UFOVP1591_36 [uncultured Caudovirales phage]